MKGYRDPPEIGRLTQFMGQQIDSTILGPMLMHNFRLTIPMHL